MSSTTKKKYVEQELEDYSLPTENQNILKIIKPRGNNLHQVLTSSGEEFLASMPPKFRKHIWVKRGDFVVTEPIHEGHKVKAEIVKILTKDQIKYYIKENVWPTGFMDVKKIDRELLESQTLSDEVENEFLVCNPNKPQWNVEVSDDSTSEEDDEQSGSDSDCEVSNEENLETTELKYKSSSNSKLDSIGH